MSNQTQSPLLTRFYKDYLEWAQSGKSGVHLGFNGAFGLCASLDCWAYRQNEKAGVEAALWEMREQFTQAGLDRDYPFGMQDFDIRRVRVALHECPARLAWVSQHI